MTPNSITLCITRSLLPMACAADEAVLTYQGKPVPPIDFAELQFAHPKLKEKVHRLNSLAGGMHLPHEIPWSRLPPSKSDGRAQHSFLAQWSTHNLGLKSLQPKQRPAMRVRINLEVDPESTDVCQFWLSTDGRPEKEGWNCSLSLQCWKPYRPNEIGAERLSATFEHTDGKSQLHVPSSGWWEVVPADIESRKDSEGVPLRTTLIVFEEPQTTAQMRALVASPDSFLAETLRALDASEADILAGIAASRRIYLAKRTVFNHAFDEWDYEDVPTPKDFALTAAEKIALVAQANAHFDQQRQLIKRNYEEMHPTMLKAFPIDKYFAREGEANTSTPE